MRAQLWAGLRIFFALTFVTGVVYPLAVTGVAQGVFSKQAQGSLVKKNGAVVGSNLIGQNFTEAKYLHPRPSAAGTNGYDATASSGSNLGPTNQKLIDTVSARVIDYRNENRLDASVKVPIDAVTASGSGLDPDISVANAKLQAQRVANARNIDISRVEQVISTNTSKRAFGFLGEPTVNVLSANLALDNLKE